MADSGVRALGYLQPQDPMFHYLRLEILPLLGAAPGAAALRVFRLRGSHPIYLYEEVGSGARVVGKFFRSKGGSRGDNPSLERELGALLTLRGHGLIGYPHHVVRPLGKNHALSVLVLEHAEGLPLSVFLDDAVHRGKARELSRRLAALAHFLATMHNRTANGRRVAFDDDCRYLDKLIRQLARRGSLSHEDARELTGQRDRWRARPNMWEDSEVLVHGDATPVNFLFGDGAQVNAIDLERMKRADRVFDVGRIAGEIQHAFLQGTGNKYAAEPFIRHFLREYCRHFPDCERAFGSITGRVPFHLAVTLLRIARNSWVDRRHRERLVQEAKITLASG